MTIDDLKELFKVRDDQDLGPIFNRGKAAVSVWRKSGVPASIERDAMRIYRRMLMEGDSRGEGPMTVDGPTSQRPAEAYDIPRSTSRIPIISWAQAGPDGFFVDTFPSGSGFGDINRPYDITDPNAYALIISGDSMIPKYEPGDVILVSPNMGVQTGDYAVVRLRDGTVTAKRIKAKDSRYILESVNPEFSPIDCGAEDVVFLHRIVWVKQRG